MAEGFEFTVSVPVEADLSRFRQQLGAELQQVQQTPAVVPVQGGGAGSALAVRPATASVVPQSAMLAAATNTAVAQAAAFDPNGWRNLHPGGWTAVNAQLARAAADAGVPAVVNSSTGQVVVGPSAGGAGEGFVSVPGMARGRGFRGGIGGLGLIGWGTALNAAGNVALAHVEHSRAVREANGDPASIIGADIAFQNRVGQSIPIVGHWAVALREMVTGDVEYTQGMLGVARQQDRTFAARRETMFSRAGIQAGPGSAGDLARAAIDYQRTVAGLTDERGRIQSELRNLPSQVTQLEYQNVLAKRADLRRIDDELGLARDTYADSTRRLTGASELQRMNVGARTAQFLDAGSGLNPSQAERRAIIRRHQIETRETELGDRSLLPDVARSHAAELYAFDRSRDRANQVRDIQSQSDVSANQLAAAGLSYEAGLERLRGQGNASIAAARNDPAEFMRRLRESVSERESYVAAHEREQEAARRFLDRDMLGSRLATVTDPLQREVVTRQFNDQREMQSAALRAGREVSGLDAQGLDKTANAVQIERQTQMQADAARRAGLSNTDREDIINTGINQLRAYQRQLRRMADPGGVTEQAAGTYAPGASSGPQTETIERGLKSVETAIKDLQAALTGT